VNIISHFTTFSTELTCTEQQAKAIIEELAKQIGATVIHSLTSYYWSRQGILIGLKNNDVPNGIGIRVENSRLVICGDSYQQSSGYSKISKLITGYGTIHKIKENAKANKIPVKLKLMLEN
jgi:hypothetical protein